MVHPYFPFAYLNTHCICKSAGKYSWISNRVFQIFVFIDCSNSVPNLLNNRVSKMNSQSCRSFEWDNINSLTVSRKSVYTLIWGSKNILRNRSNTRCNCSAVNIFPSERYWVKLIKPSLRSDQWVDAQNWMIVSMSSMIGLVLSKRDREPLHDNVCGWKQCVTIN